MKHSVLLLAWSALPWLVALTIRALRSGDWRAPAAFALVVQLAGSINLTALVFVGIGPLLWFWGWDTGPDPYGRQPARRARTARREPFYKRVFAFVFGPPPPKLDPLDDEKRIVAHIRAQQGRIAPVDLVRMMGWSFPRAEEEATRLMVDFSCESIRHAANVIRRFLRATDSMFSRSRR